jgi:asparagine synthase (glutamine-hydrolysing)
MLGGKRGRDSQPAVPAQAEEVQRFRDAVRASAAVAYRHHPGARGRLEAALLAGLSAAGFPFLLNRMDKDAMARSIETRLPYLDPEVVSLALNLPLEARTQPAPKGVLRDVARRNLPPATVRRAKQRGPMVEAPRIEGAARPEFLERGTLRELVRLPAPAWRGLLERAPRRQRMLIWTAEIWCRLFLEDESVHRVESELWAAERM